MMGKKYNAGLFDEFDDSMIDDESDYDSAERDEDIHAFFNDLDKLAKSNKGRKKKEYRSKYEHRSLPHDWKDFDYGDDSSGSNWY